MRLFLGLLAIISFSIGSANASPILVTPSATGSEVTVDVTSSNCFFCFIDTSLADDLGDVTAWLDTGDSFTFAFFDIVFGALFGGEHIELEALLALQTGDSTASAQAEGFGAYASFFFIFNGIELNWIQPNDIDLGDGTFLSVTFDNLFNLGHSNTATVTATVSRHVANVPEPGTAALLFVGLLAMTFIHRRRYPGRPQSISPA